MTFKEFVDWCEQRACDGRWGMATAVFCIDIIEEVRKQPFWRREKKWRELKDRDIAEKLVNHTNNIIKAGDGK